MKTKRILLILLICFHCVGLMEAQKLNPEIKRAKTETVGKANVDNKILKDLTKKIKSGFYPNFHSVMIIYRGRILYEEYFEGEDQVVGRKIEKIKHTKETLHDMRSISKSVTSALIGIAIQKGFIKNETQTISDFFPDHKNLFTQEKADWTIKHFLTMTTGLEWNEDISYGDPKNSEIEMAFSDNPIKHVLMQPLVEKPGTKFNYNGGATQILAEIIERSSKLQLDEFAKRYLFEPLQINKFEWKTLRKSKKIAAPSGLRLTTRDLAKFSLLYRNKGKRNEQQIVSEEWIKKSFSQHIQYPSDILEGNECYGYQFWIWEDEINGRKTKFVAAQGNGDQNIYWDLNSDLIGITTAGNYNASDIENDSYAMLKNHIYKAVLVSTGEID